MFGELGKRVGELVESKQKQYGDSVGKTGAILAVLFPNCVQPFQYSDFLLIVRILDKICRLAQRGVDGQDKGGESPYQDMAGYGLLGMRKDGK